MDNIVWFRDLKKEDVNIAGGKGASLGEMYNIPLPIPPGFVVSANVFKSFLSETGLDRKIFPLLNELKAEDTEKIHSVSKQVKEMIMAVRIPKHTVQDITEAYEHLNVNKDLVDSLVGTALDIIKVGRENPKVAVRSSATAEDLPEASFAGQQETFLNIKGSMNVVQAVQKCWASLYTPRAIYYRIKNNFPQEGVYIAVVIQKMAQSDVSGVMFSINPATNNKDEIVVEAGYGLGDAIVGGEIVPDTYIIDKNEMKIKSRKISKQKWMYDNKAIGGREKKYLSDDKGSRQKLSDEGILKLSELARRIEDHYGKPMDMEWAVEVNKIYIVQARPVTTMAKVEEKLSSENVENKGELILEGLGASPGVSEGEVKIIKDVSEIGKIKQGDILVAVMTSPDYVPAMEQAAAIITDEGALTSHAAIVSRELGIPAVVGTEEATSLLKDGDVVTVDGSSGKVYRGEVEIASEEVNFIPEVTEINSDLVTGTKVYMNLSEPDKIDDYKNLPFDGVGLMRVEFIITSEVRAHPLYLMRVGRGEEYVNKLVEGISKVARVLGNRPVIVRFSDLKSNEYKGLEGGEEFERHEENPMIGFRGISRYVSAEYIEAFKLECKAIKKIRDSGLKNVNVMLPFVRNVSEVRKVLDIMRSEGLEKSSDFGIYLMAEVPSFAILAEEFAELNVTGCSIGSNDLTQLVLGVDRDSAKLAKMGYFDERNEAVRKAISMIIKGFHKHNKTVSICGQAPSEYPEIVEFLVKEGIDAISLNPDALVKTRLSVASIERKLLLGKIRS